MKLALAFIAIVVTLSLSACTTAPITAHEVTFTPCCATHQPDKLVTLQDSFAPGGDVVRLVH